MDSTGIYFNNWRFVEIVELCLWNAFENWRLIIVSFDLSRRSAYLEERPIARRLCIFITYTMYTLAQS